MPKNGPIIVIEDDADDQELLREIFNELKIPNLLRFFDSCIKAFDYLITTMERPLIIISDINLPGMDGIEFREKINSHSVLKQKSIPFIFLSTTHDQTVISKAYELLVQGFFVKPTSLTELKEMIRTIISYWQICCHPSFAGLHFFKQ